MGQGSDTKSADVGTSAQLFIGLLHLIQTLASEGPLGESEPRNARAGLFVDQSQQEMAGSLRPELDSPSLSNPRAGVRRQFMSQQMFMWGNNVSPGFWVHLAIE